MIQIAPVRPYVLFFLCIPVWLSCSSRDDRYVAWSVYRGDHGNTAYSSLDQINTTNVQQLAVAWTYHTGDASEGSRSTIQCNPLIAHETMYLTSPKLKLIALNAATGTELWRFDPFTETEASGVNRGVTYWENGTDRRIYYSAGPYLYAIDATSGMLVTRFGEGGKIDLREGLGRDATKLAVWATSPGTIYHDLLIQGTALGEGYDAAPGFIRAFNIHTGKIIWTFHTIPQPGEFGYETWSPDAYQEVGGTNSWAGMSLDAQRGIVYLPTGSPAYDFYGGNRKGQNLFGNCLLALEAETGKLKWYYQLVHHDVWDYDLPAPPNLVTVVHEGKSIDAVAQVTKMGMVFLFDRETGEPLFDIEERPVPTSSLLDEALSATQPFPVKPRPFVRHQFTADDVTDLSPASGDFIREKIKGANLGSIYTPPSVEGTVQFPGTRGGAEWGGAAVDPHTAVLYVNANEVPLLIKMKQIEVSGADEDLGAVGQRIYTLNNCTMCHGADRAGTQGFPSLLNLATRKGRQDITDLLQHGKGQMPAYPNISDNDRKALVEFLLDTSTRDIKKLNLSSSSVGEKKYRYVHDGWNVLTDSTGYFGVKPPWGTLNAIHLNTGEILWQVPLGEYPELIAKGIPATGTQNLGGPIVTAGGLVFIGATKDEKFRAFDKHTGKMVWEYTLPAGGYATPSTFESSGKQFVVIAAGGGGKVGSKSGDSYVAFALKE